MNCRQVREYLEEFIMGDLEDSVLAEHIRDHLQECPKCRQVYEEQRRVTQLLRSYYSSKYSASQTLS
jgi:predicted anti-sigma-YlaC factor YlaD